MPVDIAGPLRQLKPERRLQALRPRPPEQADEAAPGVAKLLLLDTCAIIHGIGGRLPSAAEELVRGALQFHCTICLAEVSVGLGKYHPNSADAAAVRQRYSDTLGPLPGHRIIQPTAEDWITAGILSGTLARTQGFGADRGRAMLNDAAIFLAATRRGIPVLTENRDDFDLIHQLVGRGRIIHYIAK